MAFEVWLMFSAAAFLNVVSPGPAIILAISNGVSWGYKSVLAAALGNIMGIFILSSISMLGLGLVLKTSALLFTILKVLGACYLVYLGIKKFRSKDTFFVESEGEQIASIKINYFAKFKEAFMIAMTNPKAILFFVAFFPMFLDTSLAAFPQFMIMTLTFMALSFVSLATFGYLAKSVRHWFKNVSLVKIFHRVTGGIFIGFGVALLQVKN